MNPECGQLDPRIRRTRQLLVDALKHLLSEKDFDKISVLDIAQAATLNRATFYAHYPDKFALLEQLIRLSFLELLERRHVEFDGRCSGAFRAIILAVCDYLAELQTTPSSRQPQFEPFVQTTVIDQLRLLLLEGFRKHPAERTIPEEMIAATAGWAIYGAAKQWVNTPQRVPAEEFVAVAVTLVQTILMAGDATVSKS